MRLAAAVIDTNVVVSGILAGAPESPTVKILDGMLAGRFRFLLSVELLAEYAEVLSRRRIRRFHGLSEAEIDTVLTQIAANGVVIESMGTGGRKGDDHIRRILEVEPSAVLVTGDSHLAAGVGKTAVSPREFVERYFGS